MEQEQKTREEALLKAFRSGDAAAFDGLIEMYSAKLYKVAYALLGSRQDAEEVVQDTFLRAYRALQAFRGESSLETWLHRITLNLARNKYQWNHRRGSGLNVSLTAGDGADGDWNEASNWTVDGAAADVPPGAEGDIALVEGEAAITRAGESATAHDLMVAFGEEG